MADYIVSFYYQKQLFADVLQNRYSYKFPKFHRSATLSKRDSDTGVFL